MAQHEVFRCEPLPSELQTRLLELTHGVSMARLRELFCGVPTNSIARAAAGMAINPTTRVAIEAQIARLSGATP